MKVKRSSSRRGKKQPLHCWLVSKKKHGEQDEESSDLLHARHFPIEEKRKTERERMVLRNDLFLPVSPRLPSASFLFAASLSLGATASALAKLWGTLAAAAAAAAAIMPVFHLVIDDLFERR